MLARGGVRLQAGRGLEHRVLSEVRADDDAPFFGAAGLLEHGVRAETAICASSCSLLVVYAPRHTAPAGPW